MIFIRTLRPFMIVAAVLVGVSSCVVQPSTWSEKFDEFKKRPGRFVFTDVAPQVPAALVCYSLCNFGYKCFKDWSGSKILASKGVVSDDIERLIRTALCRIGNRTGKDLRNAHVFCLSDIARERYPYEVVIAHYTSIGLCVYVDEPFLQMLDPQEAGFLIARELFPVVNGNKFKSYFGDLGISIAVSNMLGSIFGRFSSAIPLISDQQIQDACVQNGLNIGMLFVSDAIKDRVYDYFESRSDEFAARIYGVQTGIDLARKQIERVCVRVGADRLSGKSVWESHCARLERSVQRLENMTFKGLLPQYF